MSWQVDFPDGIFLPQLDWWLDAHHPVARSFVSHAHFDHLAAHREILCSEGTARLMRARLAGPRVERVLPFGRTESLTPDTSVTLHPAGHILGSAQILLDHSTHGRLLYTGDFKLRPGHSAEPCATPPADVLVMETTYGRPHYVFPPTDLVLADVVRFCRQALDDHDTPVLFGYSLGKSQEILTALSGAALPVMLHPQALRLTTVYEELGSSFPRYTAFDPATVAGHVVISPPQPPHSAFLRKIPRPRTAALTGWALDPGARYRYQCDAVFPLSDHADFPDLLAFVERVRPRLVLTLHGFAADFARTLRQRGIEAWALGQDNQLEIPLAAPVTSASGQPLSANAPKPATSLDASPTSAASTAAHVSASAAHASAKPGSDASAALADAAPDSLARFAATAESIRLASGKLEKIALLSAFLAALDPTDAARAVVYWTGRPFPAASDRALALGWSAIRRSILEVTRADESIWRATYRRFADSGDTAEHLLAGHTDPAGRTLADLAAFFDALATDRGPLAKIDRLSAFLRELAPAEAKYVLKIISGDLRIGLKTGLVDEAIAIATGQPPENIREAHMLSGDPGRVIVAARAGTLDAISLTVFQPIQFMLASPEPTAEALLARLGPPVWLEEKYDGIRCQLHRVGPRAELYSRDLHRITGQFPDLAAAALRLPSDVVLDGELLAWRDGRALPFAELQKRLGRRGDDFFLGAEIPVTFSAYDLLWRDGTSFLKSPLRTRRAALEALLSAPAPAAFHLAPVTSAADAPAIEAAFLAARARGNEGLMAKDPDSPYTPGRRGLAWLKLKKAYATLDVVVTAVEYGHGKRRGVLSDYTFSIRDETTDELLPVGKAYSGLTNAEIATLTTHFLENTLGERGRVRTVVPDIVIEVAFDSIQPSPRHASGYALRFPRIARLRPEKTARDIDTLATCRLLASASTHPAPALPSTPSPPAPQPPL